MDRTPGLVASTRPPAAPTVRGPAPSGAGRREAMAREDTDTGGAEAQGTGAGGVTAARHGVRRRLRGLGPTAAGRVARPVGGHGVTLYHDGAEAFPAMLAAIRGATREILLEMYWFASDATGRRFADALAARARDGVRVCLIFDAVGSWDADRAMFDRLAAAGVEVIEYNPIAPWRQRFRWGGLNNRDHRKILVADGAWAATGGVNLADPWAPVEDGGDGWRDDLLAVEGPAARELRGLFVRHWEELGGAPLAPADTDSGDAAPAPEGARVRVHAGDYRDERKRIRDAYLARIRGARGSVLLANSYFVPDGAIGRALRRAARRGVDVRVLVPGESDVPAVDWASRYLYDRLLRDGVRLFRYAGPVLHAKTSVVDGRWCTVGTYNLDSRSWRFNLEVVVEVEDEGLGAVMTERFETDARRSREVTLAEWRWRSPLSRLAEAFFFLFRRFL